MLQKLLGLAVLIGGPAMVWAADAQHGAVVLRDQNCLKCHTVRGAGEGEANENALTTNPNATDLGAPLAYAYSPPALASVLWNHAPTMWDAMARESIQPPAASEQDWADLFVYFYFLQFYPRPAEAARGKDVFGDKHCSGCHTLEAPGRGSAPPVSEWQHADDPVDLAYQMWSHATAMGKEFAERRKDWKSLSGRDFRDLTYYLQGLQNRPPNTQVTLPEPETGAFLFAQNCRTCHTGRLTLALFLRNKNWMDISAGMWNHARAMQPLPPLTEAEMRSVLAYVWELQYQGPPGNVKQGQQVFESKKCVECHRSPSTGEPMHPLTDKKFTPYTMVSLGWGTGRQMHQTMIGKGIAWPELSPRDVSDLVAYMNSLPAASAGAGR